MEFESKENSNNESFLGHYVNQQVINLLPDGYEMYGVIEHCLPRAMERAKYCIASVREWNKNGFSYLIAWQYATFLYFLANEIWDETGESNAPERLFILNKALNGIELYYKIKMPDIFFLSHTVGVVFANAAYGNRCVFHQGCTVGRGPKGRPTLENEVIMFPNSMIIGNCLVRRNTVLAPGVVLVNTNTPGDCYVFQGTDGRPIYREMDKCYADEYFERGS